MELWHQSIKLQVEQDADRTLKQVNAPVWLTEDLL